MSGWDVMGKAQEVQEAAAKAILAKRERFLDAAENLEESDSDADLSREHYADICPWPADPYSMDVINEVPSHFEWLADRDPAPLAGKKQSVIDTASNLRDREFGQLSNLKNLLAQDKVGSIGIFTGGVASAFNAFLTEAMHAAQTQADLGDELASFVATMEGYLDATKKDVDSVAKTTIKALEAIETNSVGGPGSALFTVAGVAVAIVGGAFSGGLTWALIGGGLTLAEAAVDEAGDIGSDSVEVVLSQMFTEIGKRRDNLDHKENEMCRALTYDIGKAQANEQRLCPDTKQHNMYDGRGDLGLTERVTSAAVHTIHGYATGVVPNVAANFGSSSTALAGECGIGAQAMGTASASWDSLCTILQRYTALTSKRVYRGGDVLAKAMVDFAEQDGSNARWVQEPFEEHHGPTIPDPYVDPNPPTYMGLGDFR